MNHACVQLISLVVTVVKLGNITEQNLGLDKRNLKRQNESQGTQWWGATSPINISKIWYCVVHDMMHILHQTVLYFQDYIVTWDVCKHNFIHVHWESLAFPELIFRKLINAQLHYMHLSYTKFYQKSNNKIGKQPTQRNTIIPRSVLLTQSTVTKLTVV